MTAYTMPDGGWAEPLHAGGAVAGFGTALAGCVRAAPLQGLSTISKISLLRSRLFAAYALEVERERQGLRGSPIRDIATGQRESRTGIRAIAGPLGGRMLTSPRQRIRRFRAFASAGFFAYLQPGAVGAGRYGNHFRYDHRSLGRGGPKRPSRFGEPPLT